jgi:hypothetical protein
MLMRHKDPKDVGTTITSLDWSKHEVEPPSKYFQMTQCDSIYRFINHSINHHSNSLNVQWVPGDMTLQECYHPNIQL